MPCRVTTKSQGGLNDDGHNHYCQHIDYDRNQCVVRSSLFKFHTEIDMKVTKAQVQANRARVVETASHLFRERGYDGVGIADLMSAAGLTHGGFYKHFASKSDLIAESAACGFAQTAGQSADGDIAGLITRYLSREHRDNRTNGCTIAALGGDAARQSDVVRASFSAGIEDVVAALSGAQHCQPALPRAELLDILAHAVGALVMSRACPDDSPLADEILATCRERILAALAQAG